MAEHPVGQGMAVAIPQILLEPHTLNFELNYLGKILSLYTLGQVLYWTFAFINPATPYLNFVSSSATVVLAWPMLLDRVHLAY